ncbi:MAG: aminoglycoside phosphotransferase family protein [Acidithiobacillus sp.]|uniref:aminoglycoside phosphotransferase family protein n=1 Tax=Acidithiobacillus sp. TaxID=1872118 RepID=UPI003CFF032D
MSQSPATAVVEPPALSAQVRSWLAQERLDAPIEALRGDASARRYWRLRGAILAEFPPEDELLPFLRVQYRWQRAGLPVPRILAVQPRLGLILQEDLGDEDLKARLDRGAPVAASMEAALDLVLRLAAAGRGQWGRPALPVYDRARLDGELQLFRDWYLPCQQERPLSSAAAKALDDLFATLVARALAQPRVWVHRDFHARNILMHPRTGELTLIDFQDAVEGPWTYDLASLLWDRYWDWGPQQRAAWIESYRQRLADCGFAPPPPTSFAEQVQSMALQRNLKILGIFCRLARRDGKEHYLEFLPRFWSYVWQGLGRDPELAPYREWFAPWAPSSVRP